MKKKASKNQSIEKSLNMTDSEAKIEALTGTEKILYDMYLPVFDNVVYSIDEYCSLEKNIFLQKVRELIEEEYTVENIKVLTESDVRKADFVNRCLFCMDVLYDTHRFDLKNGYLNKKQLITN